MPVRRAYGCLRQPRGPYAEEMVAHAERRRPYAEAMGAYADETLACTSYVVVPVAVNVLVHALALVHGQACPSTSTTPRTPLILS